MARQISTSYPIFNDTDGSALTSGYIYIGEKGKNPLDSSNQLSVYYDSSLTTPAVQPIRTINGYPSRNGSPAQLFVEPEYSIIVQNSRGEQVYSSLSPLSPVNSSDLPWYDALDYGTGSYTDETISSALSTLGSSSKYVLLIRKGDWTIDSDLTITDNVELYFENGADLTISDSLLTINGPTNDIVSKIFTISGTGEVRFGNTYTKQIYPQWWGAVGDGATDCTLPIQYAVTCGIRSSVPVYIPNGTYIIKPSTGNNFHSGTGSTIRLDFLTAEGQGLVMRGAGMGQTIIKEFDGETASGGKFTRMFMCFFDEAPYDPGHYVFEDITFNKNATSDGTPSTPFAWESAHIIAFQGSSGASNCTSLTFRNLEFIDKVAGCIVYGPSPTDSQNIFIENIISTDHPSVAQNGGPIGQKGDIEIAGDVANGVIDSVNILYSQIEPTAAASSDRQRKYKIANSKIQTFEYTDNGFNTTGKSYSYVDMVNTDVPIKFLTRGVRLNVSNSRLAIPDSSQELYTIDAQFSNCEILLPYDDTGPSITPFYINTPSSWASLNETSKATLVNCDFKINAETVSASVTGYAMRANLANTYTPEIKLVGCTFDDRLYGVVDAYGTGGKWKFIGCELAGHTRAIQAGTFSTYTSAVELRDCSFDKVTGEYLKVLSPSTNHTLKISGDYLSSDWSQTWTTTGAIQAIYTGRPTLWGTAAPSSGQWFLGDRVYNTTPSADGNDMILNHWVCTTAGTPGTWAPQYISTVSPAT